MGVPGFFRWLVNRYPLTRICMHDPSRPRFNNLYIDMNGILYKAAEVTNIKENRLTADFAAEMSRYLDMLVQFCRPTDTLFIAVDGCAPSAKNLQQRSRRFKSGHDMHPGSFDRCNFTPGTQFMNEINNYLIDFIKERKQTDSAWMAPNVVYSSSFVPGEGEHKILDYIRSCRNEEGYKSNMTHILYSTDADLIFLTLRTHEPYFSILREADSSSFQKTKQKFEFHDSRIKWSADDFEILNISLVREYLSVDMNVTGDELEKTIDDFVALSFLVGNDFIPEFSDIVIQKGSFNTIVNCFKEIRAKRNNDHLIGSDGEYNKSFLKELFERIVAELEEIYEEQNKKNPKKVSYEEYNRQYLLSKFPERKDDLDALIKDMAFNILNAFNWVLLYYESGCPSWTWSYRYNYSPPLQLILPYIDEYQHNFELGSPTRPLLQLLFVLPPQSANLMPKELRKLIVPPSPIADLYPTDFEIDMNGKKNDYQATILIPILDFDRVREEYKKIEPNLLPEELALNKVMKPILFQNGKEPVELDLRPCILTSVNRSTEAPPCVPTLHTLHGKLSFEIKKADVTQFEFPSKLESVVITVNNAERKISFDKAKCLLNQQIIFGWPYLKIGTVLAISNGEETVKNESFDLPQFHSFNRIQSDYKSKFAIDVGPIEIALQVMTTVPLNIDETDFASVGDIETVPYQLTFDIKPNHEITDKFDNTYKTVARFTPAKTIKPKVGETVVFTGGAYEGRIGTIDEITDSNKYNITVHQSEPKVPKSVASIIDQDKKQWIEDKELVKKFHLPFKVLNKLFSSIYIKSEAADIAFTLFTKQKTSSIDGICKIGDDKKSYFVNSSIVPLIEQYISKTGNLIQLIVELQASKPPKDKDKDKDKDKNGEKKDAFAGKPHKLSDTKEEKQPSKEDKQPSKEEKQPSNEPIPLIQKPQKKYITLEGMFGGDEANQKAKYKELADWLLINSPAAHYPMVPASKNSLSLNTIANLEKELINFKPKIVQKKAANVSDSLIRWSNKHESNNSMFLPALGSRVVYVSSTGPVRFGTFGYVIAFDVEERKVVVVFDDELKCGTSLEGLLQTNRGLEVNCNDISPIY